MYNPHSIQVYTSSAWHGHNFLHTSTLPKPLICNNYGNEQEKELHFMQIEKTTKQPNNCPHRGALFKFFAFHREVQVLW